LSTFSTILADPPWAYSNKEGPRAAPLHRPKSWENPLSLASSSVRYGSMPMAELKALRVEEHAAANAHLYLWVTNGFLVEGHDLARAWGFKPKTLITWGKVRADGTPSMRMGFYYRGATEHILFAVRGKMRLRGAICPTLHLSKRLPHSVKPDWAYDMIEAQSPGPYLEMFARRERSGWTSWGNEIANDVPLTIAADRESERKL
jgi:N6-adenosine-specific RNA methylase IME4